MQPKKKKIWLIFSERGESLASYHPPPHHNQRAVSPPRGRHSDLSSILSQAHTTTTRALEGIFRNAITRKDYCPWILHGGEMLYTLMCVCITIHIPPTTMRGFPGGASGEESACQCRRPKRRGFDPWVGKIPWRRKWQPTPVFVPGESQGQRSLARYSPQGHKELDVTEATQH